MAKAAHPHHITFLHVIHYCHLNCQSERLKSQPPAGDSFLVRANQTSVKCGALHWDTRRAELIGSDWYIFKTTSNMGIQE